VKDPKGSIDFRMYRIEKKIANQCSDTALYKPKLKNFRSEIFREFIKNTTKSNDEIKKFVLCK